MDGDASGVVCMEYICTYRLPTPKMVAFPRHGVLNDLTVYTGITAELSPFRPVFKIEEIAEELKYALLVEQAQANGVAEIAPKQCRCLLQLGQHPRGRGYVFHPASARTI